MDLTDLDQIRRIVREVKSALIVNPTAYAAVDRAESEADLAKRINAFEDDISQLDKRIGAWQKQEGVSRNLRSAGHRQTHRHRFGRNNWRPEDHPSLKAFFDLVSVR